MFKTISRDLLTVDRPIAKIKGDLKLLDHLRLEDNGKHTVAEFIGTDNFAAAWYSRQAYEVNAGRDEEPILYEPLYQIIEDSNLPRALTINQLGPAGVVLEEIEEGGEVKFMTVGGGTITVTQRHYGVGLQYNKDLVIFNELWRLPIIERQVGVAYNALLNNIHFSPILAASYAAANQTAGSATATTTDLLVVEYLKAIQDAINASSTDTSNPRRGPYWLLISSADQFFVDAALKRRIQDGIDVQSSAVQQIRGVIVYDGWTGTRGNKTTTYSGVTAGTAYLVSMQYANRDFQSYVRQSLDSVMGNADVSRFILEQVVYDTYLGAYANPAGSVEEITWPTLAE